MSFYVARKRWVVCHFGTKVSQCYHNPRCGYLEAGNWSSSFGSWQEGWTGPIRSERQADREAQAWVTAGWHAERVASTPEIRAQVRAWQRTADERQGRR